jgi:hypothetical protein
VEYTVNPSIFSYKITLPFDALFSSVEQSDAVTQQQNELMKVTTTWDMTPLPW